MLEYTNILEHLLYAEHCLRPHGVDAGDHSLVLKGQPGDQRAYTNTENTQYDTKDA